MDSYEKLGLFYLGKLFDPATQQRKDEYLLYESRQLVTHAVCVGMTGSGKTGLCVGILEEAAIDGIPAIVIDPKGDLGDLLLTFPALEPRNFLPWVNPDEAQRKGLSLDQFAADQAESWRKGLAEWDQDAARIARLREAADFAIYTPGSVAGLPVSLLKSFAPPVGEALADADLMRDRVMTTVSGLLGLAGIVADPIHSREHILISNILDHTWRQGQSLDLASLIRLIQSPPLARIGVFELDAFYPAAERLKLAMTLNNLLAAPGFEAWMEGTPLEVDRLLYTPSGKPRVSIFSIAHLSDSERMFFVTLLLNQLIGWMRAQPGTTSLRALLYMDEVFGFLPPVAEPPSKRPFLTLLKQARAFGLGVVLATQNPVDLDYKGLSNTGTWFIGRLQTERDKERLLEGLSSASSAAGGAMDAGSLSDLLSRLGKRVFLMHSVHEPRPALFQTRWTLSYLSGPLTRMQIKELTDPRRAAEQAAAGPSAQPATPAVTPPPLPQASVSAPSLPQSVAQYYTRIDPSAPVRDTVLYPYFFAAARVHLIDNRLGLSQATDLLHVYPITEGAQGFLWDNATRLSMTLEGLSTQAPSGRGFATLPAEAIETLKSGILERGYRDYLTRAFQLSLWKSNIFKLTSQPGESDRDFRIRLAQMARERRDFELDVLRQKYASKFDALSRQEQSARLATQREEQQYDQQKLQTMISVGGSLLGALFGRSRGSVGRVTTVARGAGRMSRERQDIQRAQEKFADVQQRKAALEQQLKVEADRVAAAFDPQTETLQEIVVRPKKTDVLVRASGLLWMPAGAA
jgi:hypothetical protein